ncbi:hypothetical protein [Kerstersia gyiorum]|uniref:Uncharacterized protein n=2 Tax=Kerstersia gyiorum TaxID=206506 RepID=A0A171KQ29_9BURK|nr:hypothetical protein [Kerstersia gyiorum]KAB0544156.1 hypothetical protein F7P85_05945 [Kerstersia gyiorum]KKO70996.1 hypothetical protein AAV32_13490 [Kerstersia gyiorum]MCP1631900.1 hypothetical protein [Kerstersia gyiorum]MCP1637816.1 hypothetical protein [Kerstersia gyiorum]MCP1672022.1 hypothetical protein [Kerstersia gyiorum]
MVSDEKPSTQPQDTITLGKLRMQAGLQANVDGVPTYKLAKQHDDEMRICESWIAIDEDFTNQTTALAGGTPPMPRSQVIHTRIGKARVLRDKATLAASTVLATPSVNPSDPGITSPASHAEKN